MKRVLVITHSFPPMLEARSIQTVKIVRYLKQFGWDPVILTVDPDQTPIGQDHSLSDLIPGDIRVIRTGTFSPKWVVSILARTWTSLLHLPDKQVGWIPYAKAEAGKLISSGQVDLIYTNAKPFTCHLIGKALKDRYGLPWVSYFSDPWVDSPYFGRQSGWQIDRNTRMQDEIVRESDGLVYNNPETRDQMLKAADVRASTRVIPHCFDKSLFKRDAIAAPDKTCRVVHTGNFYGVRSPLPLIRAAKKLKKTRDGRSFSIQLVGKIDPEHRHAISKEGLANHVEIVDSVSYLESLEYARRADILVSVDAPVEGDSVFFPSKLVDYLGAERPIVAITPRGSTTDRILTKHGHFVADVEKQTSIQSSLMEAADAVERDWTAPEQYCAEKIAGELAQHFAEVYERCGS